MGNRGDLPPCPAAIPADSQRKTSDGGRACTPTLAIHRPRRPSLPAVPTSSTLPAMYCFHTYDHEFDLVALTALDGGGQQWTTILDPDEAHHVARLATGDVRTASTCLSLDELRTPVIQVTGRDPCQ
jgi:hypothetical protein